MMKQINVMFTFSAGVATSLVAIVNNKQYTTDNTHPNWTQVLEAIRNDNVNGFIAAIDIRSAVENFMVGSVRISGNEVWHGNTRLGGVVVDRIFDFMGNNLPVQPIMLFIDKLFQNPSSRAVNELYRFLEHENLPLTTNGNFRAYKGLQESFYSITAGNLTLIQGRTDESGHIFNGVGETIECIRHQVDDDKDQTCSKGLHAGSLEYAKGFAQGKMVIVEINPMDVVSIPSDCNGEKLRTCKYSVVEEYVTPLDNVYVKTTSFNNNPLPVAPLAPVVDNDDDSDDDSDDDDECDSDDCGDEDCNVCNAPKVAAYTDEDDRDEEDADDNAIDAAEAAQNYYDSGHDDGYTDGVQANGYNPKYKLTDDNTKDYLSGYNEGYDSGVASRTS